MGFGSKVGAVFKTGLCVVLLGSLMACQGGMGSYAGKTGNSGNCLNKITGQFVIPGLTRNPW